MLGLAMLLVSTGAECASAAPAMDKMKRAEAEKRHQFTQHVEGAYGVRHAEAAQQVAAIHGNGVEYRKYDAHGRVTHAATISGPPMVAPGWSVPLSVVSALDAPPVNRHAKPRSKSGQRRAHARGRR